MQLWTGAALLWLGALASDTQQQQQQFSLDIDMHNQTPVVVDRTKGSSSFSLPRPASADQDVAAMPAADDSAASNCTADDECPPASPDAFQPKLLCISCLTSTPSYSKMNYTQLLLRLTGMGGLHIPKVTPACQDTPAILRANFEDTDVVECHYNASSPTACVKLRGIFQQEEFVYRSCWNQMWKSPRNLKPDHMGSCFQDVRFIQTMETSLCFCQNDMCNGTAAPRLATAVIFILIILCIL